MLPSCPSLDQWHQNVPRSAKMSTIMGLVVLLVSGGGFGLWATIAPLDGAVVTAGSFVATGQNKQVQHLEGGIIHEILVKEGDLVETNQLLMRLDATAARAKLRRLILRKYRLVAMQSRLDAEMHSKTGIEAPDALLSEVNDPEVLAIFDRQRIELQARRAKLKAEEEVLRKEIAGLRESISGYEFQAQSTRERIALFNEELRDKRNLFERQLIRKTDVLAVQRAEVSLSGELGELLGRIADSKERIARAEQQIVHLHTAAIQKVIEELRTAEAELDDVQEQIRAAQDIVQRTEVVAPVRGIVVKLHHHTRAGVVASGAVILELLPINDELVLEARVNPSDILHVKEGQDALVRLTALNQRLIPMIAGKVVYISADAIAEHNARKGVEQAMSKQNSFVVRVRLDERDTRNKTDNFRPTPGLPADIFIKTGERTFFQYILRPILDSFARSFREQ